MIPKVECALTALRAGVATVRIVNGAEPGSVARSLRGEGGTSFCR
jgi:acetylglutamate kinase